MRAQIHTGLAFLRDTAFVVALGAAGWLMAVASGCGSGRKACQSNADCDSSRVCAFDPAAGCSATGQCLDLSDRGDCSDPPVGGGPPPITACGCKTKVVQDVCDKPLLFDGPVGPAVFDCPFGGPDSGTD